MEKGKQVLLDYQEHENLLYKADLMVRLKEELETKKVSYAIIDTCNGIYEVENSCELYGNLKEPIEKIIRIRTSKLENKLRKTNWINHSVLNSTVDNLRKDLQKETESHNNTKIKLYLACIGLGVFLLSTIVLICL